MTVKRKQHALGSDSDDDGWQPSASTAATAAAAAHPVPPTASRGREERVVSEAPIVVDLTGDGDGCGSQPRARAATKDVMARAVWGDNENVSTADQPHRFRRLLSGDVLRASGQQQQRFHEYDSHFERAAKEEVQLSKIVQKREFLLQKLAARLASEDRRTAAAVKADGGAGGGDEGGDWQRLPHPPHLCLETPFERKKDANRKTNVNTCENCWCFVCDIKAHECPKWCAGLGAGNHCNAFLESRKWRALRAKHAEARTEE